MAVKLPLAALVALALASVLAIGWLRLVRVERAPAASGDPVLVVVLATPENVDVVRETLPESSMVYSTPEALALPKGQILVSRVEAASDALNALGWTDRPLEILDPSRGPLPRHSLPSAQPSAQPSASSAQHPAALSLARLAKKKTLTPLEAIHALELLR